MAIKILIADDEPNQLELLSFNLTKAGFDVTKAHHGREALEIAQDLQPDLLVLDWMMSELSGIEVVKALRKSDELRHIPVVMLSARGEEGDRTFGLDIGADDYITKPFSPRELVSRIKAILRRTNPALSGKIQTFDDITIDHDKKVVMRGSDEVHLGPKEFQILAVLMDRPGQVYSREQLLDKVWGQGVYVEDRTVDVYLSRLRKALNNAPNGGDEKADVIRAVRGAGYALRMTG